MRKISREMSSDWALEIMRKAPYITVSFTRADGTAYGVPLSLACASDNVWYFHCAPEGDKLDALAVHPEVCLSAVTKCQPTVGPKDGTFTLQYRSAIAFGKAELVTDDDEKIHALKLISQRFLPKHMEAFDDAVKRSIHRTAVVRITLTGLPTGKRICGETGIRTPGTSRYNGFQDRRNRPLCHLSKTPLGSASVFLRRCKGTNHF